MCKCISANSSIIASNIQNLHFRTDQLHNLVMIHFNDIHGVYNIIMIAERLSARQIIVQHRQLVYVCNITHGNDRQNENDRQQL